MLFIKVFLLISIATCGAHNLNDEFEKISTPRKFAEAVQRHVGYQNTNISEKCLEQVLYYVENLKQMKTWAVEMFDATSKLPSGLLSGNDADLGTFDQCLEVQQTVNSTGEIIGKYCLGSVSVDLPMILRHSLAHSNHIENKNGLTSNIRWSICVPDTCSASEIEEIFITIGLNHFKFSEETCQTLSTQPELTGGDIAILSVFGFVGLLTLISTIYEAYVMYKKKKPAHVLLLSFSVISNAKKIFTVKENDESYLYCLRGVRAISMLWVMLGHRYTIMSLLPLRNSFYISQWMDNRLAMFVINASLATDTFLLVSGILVSYGFLKATKEGTKFNIFKYYIHRYLRLTPILAIVIVIHLTIFKHLTWGPVWPEFSKSVFIDGCQEYWWTTLLYVQNYVDQTAVCVPQSWYLAIDFQLFLLSPLILLPLRRWPTRTLYSVGGLILCNILACFLIGYFYEIKALYIKNETDLEKFLQLYYMPMHTRAAPWLIGILVGYFIYQIKHESKACPKRWIILLCWFLNKVILATCIFSGEGFLKTKYDRWNNSLHLAFIRPLWALTVGWIIFASSCGFGGVANKVLSLPPFDLLAKLSYGVYLIHFVEMAVVSGRARASLTFSDIDAGVTLGGDVPACIVLSLILTLAFESPIVAIENYIFRNRQIVNST